MAMTLDKCPPAVKDADIRWDTLRVSVPYKGVDDNVVEVPPLVPDNDFGRWLQGSAGVFATLTTAEGRTPETPQASSNAIVGWEKDQEKEERDRLAEEAEGMIEAVDQGEIHPSAAPEVRQLAMSALEDLEKVNGYYEAWSGSLVPARPSDSEFSFYKRLGGYGPIGLDQEWIQIQTWMVDPEEPLGGGGRPSEHENVAALLFSTFAELLDGETGGWWGPGHTPTARQLRDAMIAAREKTRQKIRTLLRTAYEKIWCAEYGVAQSESFYANKAQWERGPGRFAPKDSWLAPPVTQGGGTEADPDDFDFGEDELPDDPPLDQGSLDQAPEVPPPPPPAQVPVAPPTKWYQTPAGKVAIGVGGVAVLAAAGYGFYTYYRQRQLAA